MDIKRLSKKLSVVEGASICVKSKKSGKVTTAVIVAANVDRSDKPYMIINFGAWKENYSSIKL